MSVLYQVGIVNCKIFNNLKQENDIKIFSRNITNKTIHKYDRFFCNSTVGKVG
jgi:hypothetical protein